MENEVVESNVALDESIMAYASYDWYEQQIINQQATIIEYQEKQISILSAMYFVITVILVLSIFRRMISR